MAASASASSTSTRTSEPRRCAPPPNRSPNRSPPKKLVTNDERSSALPAARAVAAAREPVMPEAIVALPRVGIGEHLVGLGDLAELGPRHRARPRDVGVQLARQRSKRALERSLVDAPLNAEHLVVVTFRLHRPWNQPTPGHCPGCEHTAREPGLCEAKSQAPRSGALVVIDVFDVPRKRPRRTENGTDRRPVIHAAWPDHADDPKVSVSETVRGGRRC